MRTAITELLGIDVPVLAFSHCRDVVAAVSRAGGMGILGAVAHSPEALEVDLAWIEEQVGDRPYGIDVIVPARYAGSDGGGLSLQEVKDLIPQEHVAFVDELLRRYAVPPMPEADATAYLARASNRSGDTAVPFSARQADSLLDVALGHRPSLVVNALGPPPPHMIERAKAEGRLVGALAGKAQHAERHVAAGVDVIIAQGAEAGGHTGEIGTMVLVPEVVDAVAPIPVLAAGGIGRGRQMAAALALGAQGVWCGSVWLTTDEAETHPVVKQKLLAATSSDTVRSRSRTGKPARQLRSAWTDEWDDPANPEPLSMPLQPILVHNAITRIERAAHRPGSGAAQLANYFVGQVVGTMNAPKTAAQVVYEMVDELIWSVEDLARCLGG